MSSPQVVRVRFRIHWPAVLSSLLLLGLAQVASAQQMARPSAQVMAQYEQATVNTVAYIRRKVEPVLTAEQGSAFGSIQLRVEPESWDVYGIRAKKVDGAPLVVIPLGFVVILDHIDSAFVAGQVGGIARSVVEDYARALNEGIRENLQRAERKEKMQALPEFPQFAKLTPTRWQRITSDPKYTALKEEVKIASFAFIYLHEVAHHIVPDAGFDRLTKVREPAADQFAVATALRAGLNPMFAMYTFSVFSAMESPEVTGYDPVVCRMLLFTIRGMNAAESDPGLKDYLRARGMLDDWQSAPARVKQVLQEDGVTCPAIEKELSSTPAGQANVKRHSVSLVIWRPTPGQCDGIEMSVRIDGKLVSRLKNTRDSSPIYLGPVDEGTHEFAFENISGYCIGERPPYPLKRFSSGRSCEGRFSVRDGGDLDLVVREAAPGRIECAIR